METQHFQLFFSSIQIWIDLCLYDFTIVTGEYHKNQEKKYRLLRLPYSSLMCDECEKMQIPGTKLKRREQESGQRLLSTSQVLFFVVTI